MKAHKRNIFYPDQEACPTQVLLYLSLLFHISQFGFSFNVCIFLKCLILFVFLQGILAKSFHICYICDTVFSPSGFFLNISTQQSAHQRLMPTFHLHLPIHRFSSFSVALCFY